MRSSNSRKVMNGSLSAALALLVGAVVIVVVRVLTKER